MMRERDSLDSPLIVDFLHFPFPGLIAVFSYSLLVACVFTALSFSYFKNFIELNQSSEMQIYLGFLQLLALLSVTSSPKSNPYGSDGICDCII